MENEEILKMQRKKLLIYKFIKKIGYDSIFDKIYNPIIEGENNIPKEGRGILVGNHKEAGDPFSIIRSTPRTVSFASKRSLNKPIINIPTNLAGSVYVMQPARCNDCGKILEKLSDDNLDATVAFCPECNALINERSILKKLHPDYYKEMNEYNLKALGKMSSILELERLLCIFFEGTRCKDKYNKELLETFDTFYMLSIRKKADVTPFAIGYDGKQPILNYGPTIPHEDIKSGRKNGIVKHEVLRLKRTIERNL